MYCQKIYFYWFFFQRFVPETETASPSSSAFDNSTRPIRKRARIEPRKSDSDSDEFELSSFRPDTDQQMMQNKNQEEFQKKI